MNHLVPCWKDDLEKLQRLDDHTYKCVITQPRNLGHHRKYWALLNLVYDNLPEHLEHNIRSVEDLHYEMKLQTGWREKYITMGGQVVWKVKSISFEKMTQEEFEDFYDICLVVISRYILPGITKEELINQIIEF